MAMVGGPFARRLTVQRLCVREFSLLKFHLWCLVQYYRTFFITLHEVEFIIPKGANRICSILNNDV